MSLLKGGNLNTDMHTGRMPSEDEIRDQGDASASQGMPKMVVNHQNLPERCGTDSPSQPSEEAKLG